MIDHKYNIVHRSRAYSGFLKIDRYSVEMPDETTRVFECMNRGDSVAAVVHDMDGDYYYFVKQWRPGPENHLLELIAGSLKLEESEKPELAIIREIEEELGIVVNPREVNKISEFYVSPGGTSEKIHLYSVRFDNSENQQIKTTGGLHEEGEFIEIFKMTYFEINQYFKENAHLLDAKTLIGLAYIKSQRNY